MGKAFTRIKNRVLVNFSSRPQSKDYLIFFFVPIFFPLISIVKPSIGLLMHGLNDWYLTQSGSLSDSILSSANAYSMATESSVEKFIVQIAYLVGYLLSLALKHLVTLYANIYLWLDNVLKLNYQGKVLAMAGASVGVMSLSKFLTGMLLPKRSKKLTMYLIMSIGFFPLSLLTLPLIAAYELILLLKPQKTMYSKKQTRQVMVEAEPSNMAVMQEENYSENIFEEGYKNQPDSYKSLGEVTDFDALIGQEEVKEKIRRYVKLVEINKDREKNGFCAFNSSYHIAMMGNPGTGKTEFAKAIGKLFRKMGVVKNDKFIEVDRSSLVSCFVGKTESKVQELFESALGGILFIDEAYALYKKNSINDVGQEAIDKLVKLMDHYRNDIIVIVAGYQEEMQEFLSSNPGLDSRFNVKLHFKDYTSDELYQIFISFCEKDKMTLASGAERVLKQEIDKMFRRKRKDFGNAREVRNLYDEIVSRLAVRLSGQKNNKAALTTILPEDINPEFNSEFNGTSNQKLDVFDELNTLVGMKQLKKELKSLVNTAIIEKQRAEKGLPTTPPTMHMIFKGNPGTGKTTAARMLAGAYKQLGLLSSGHMNEVTRADLVGAYIGQTEEKTMAKVRAALGGVLFVDEAYTLTNSNANGNDFGVKALEIIMREMENNREDLMVIFAGYPDEMEQFINTNSGIKSRIPTVIDFPDYSNSELVKIFKNLCDKNGTNLTPAAENKLKRLFAKEPRDKNFGNARLVRNVYESVMKKKADRLMELSPEERDSVLNDILPEDI